MTAPKDFAGTITVTRWPVARADDERLWRIKSGPLERRTLPAEISMTTKGSGAKRTAVRQLWVAFPMAGAFEFDEHTGNATHAKMRDWLIEPAELDAFKKRQAGRS